MSAGAIAFGTIASSGTAHAATRSTIASSRPVWARPANRVGGVDAGTDIVVRVYLKLRDRAGLDAVAASVSDPRSRQYRHFLTTAQVRDRYAPSDVSVASVRSWLAASGLRLLGQPANNLYVEAAGPAAASPGRSA